MIDDMGAGGIPEDDMEDGKDDAVDEIVDE